MSVLHIFDMDGTLLRGTTASLEIARALGCVDELHELEHAFGSGQMVASVFAQHVFQLWHGLTPEIVTEAACNAPWINGIADVFADIQDRGEQSLVITMSPDFFANHLASMGTCTVSASRFPVPPFSAELDVSGILTPQDKVTIAENMLRTSSARLENSVAYGDSSSDIPLFQSMSNTVSINGDMHIESCAGARYRGDDLWEAYSMARAKYLMHKSFYPGCLMTALPEQKPKYALNGLLKLLLTALLIAVVNTM